MNWSDVHKKYSQTWLVVEALHAETKKGKRKIHDVAILHEHKNSVNAYRIYQELHKRNPHKEMYVVYSEWKKLLFEELNWKGMRGLKTFA